MQRISALWISSKRFVCFNFHRSMTATAMATSTATTSQMFELPNVGGMTKLDRSHFKKTIELPVLRIPAQLVGRIIGLKSIRQSTIPSKQKWKPIMNGDSPSEKLVVFDPTALAAAGPSAVLADVANVSNAKTRNDGQPAELRFETLRCELNYEDWDVKSCLRVVLPPELEFSGYAQVGHIAHLNLREELLPYKFTIAEILLDKIAWVRTVVNKLNAINNEFRFFDMELLAGEPDYVTTVAEAGVKYRFDFSKVFWNSRLTNVHELIIRRFDTRSVVFDVFAGVGPFVLPAVLLKGARRCFANDLNPASVHYLRENVRLNKVAADRIEAFNLDGADFIRDVIPVKLAEARDEDTAAEARGDGMVASSANFHAVMNLPCLAVEFLPHFHGFLSRRPELRDYFATNPFRVYCHLFVKAKEEHPREWFRDRAVELVRDRLRLPALEIEEAYYIRTVASNKEMFCVAFCLPADYAFDASPLLAKERTISDSTANETADDDQTESPAAAKPHIPPVKRDAAIVSVSGTVDEATEPKIRRAH